MMINSVQYPHEQLLLRVAKKYRRDKYEVVTEPQPDELPFDLGIYRPDLLVKKPDGTGYIIEIKSSASHVSVERYREIAEMISKYQGWRFLLVTGDDNFLDDEEDIEQLLSLREINERKVKSDHLVSIGELEAAFLSLWSIAEAIMRRQAKKALIPIERFPPISLIKHLFSQGELSMEQYDRAMALVEVRNRLVHGFQTHDLNESVNELQKLVDDLMNSEDWVSQA